MPDFSAPAYAKINLTLDITGRRRDGYHLLRTVMQSITLSDRISLTRTGNGQIQVVCDRREVPCGNNNTVYRAAEAFFERTGIPNCGVRFDLEKRIPWQAGLGGGSADAAEALRMLNRCFGAGIDPDGLCSIGLEVGADIPFCILRGTALAEGIGEKLTPLEPLPDCHIIICKPAAGMETREAYQAIDRSGKEQTNFTGPMLDALKAKDFVRVAARIGNVFEQAAALPENREISRRMRAAGADGACMTGSGSAVFGLFRDRTGAEACRSELAGLYPDVFLCAPFNPVG